MAFVTVISLFSVPSLSPASVSEGTGDIIIKAVPVQANWIADGTTEYEVKIYADNTGLAGESTKAAQWQLLKPVGLEDNIIMISAQWPTQNDFFEGFNVLFPILGVNWGVHTKLVNNPGPANKAGVLAVYKFKVNPGFTGQTNFDFVLGETGFCQSGGTVCTQQPYHIEYVPFIVTTPKVISTTGPATQVSVISKKKICPPANPLC